jgi:hypothetical protein
MFKVCEPFVIILNGEEAVSGVGEIADVDNLCVEARLAAEMFLNTSVIL